MEHDKSTEKPIDKANAAERKRHAVKVIDSPPSNNKLFSGKAVWGPGGYARDHVKPASEESSSRSDSSSRSSGSEKQMVLKTKAEVKRFVLCLAGNNQFVLFFSHIGFYRPCNNVDNYMCIRVYIFS